MKYRVAKYVKNAINGGNFSSSSSGVTLFAQAPFGHSETKNEEKCVSVIIIFLDMHDTFLVADIIL